MGTTHKSLQRGLWEGLQKARELRLAVLVALLLALALMPATWAFAEEAASKGSSEALTVEHRYFTGETLPETEETITAEDGSRYRLVSESEPTLDLSYKAPTRLYTRQITKKIPLDGINRLEEYFPARLSIRDGEYVGFIGLGADPYQIEDVYESWTGQADRHHEIEGLPDNDVVRLPPTMDFEVSSDAAPDATQTKTLALLDVRYEITGTSALGLPTSYKAYLTYRGEESWLELHHHIVTATYEGTVASAIPRYLVTIVYEPEPEATPPEPVSAERPRDIAEVEVPTAAPAFPLGLLAAAAVVVLVLGWLLLWLLLFRKNAELVRREGEGWEVLVRRRLSVTDGVVGFEVPDQIELCDGARYSVELKPWLANQEGELLVSWRKRVIAREGLAPSVKLKIGSIDDEGVLSVLAEEILTMMGAETES